MRRALLISLAAVVVLMPARAAAADKTIEIGLGGVPSPANVTINGGESVTWTNRDVTGPHEVFIDGGPIGDPIAPNGSQSQSFPDPGDADAEVPYHIDSVDGPGGTITIRATTTTTTPTTEPATTATTTKPATTSSSTTSTSSTTTSSSTTTTVPVASNFSGPVSINEGGKSGGGSSALPLLLGALLLVGGLAGFAYWLWWRSGEPYDEDDDGPDWTQEPPPTVQGPRI